MSHTLHCTWAAMTGVLPVLRMTEPKHKGPGTLQHPVPVLFWRGLARCSNETLLVPNAAQCCVLV